MDFSVVKFIRKRLIYLNLADYEAEIKFTD